jgi:hypothetical protein
VCDNKINCIGLCHADRRSVKAPSV